MNNYDYAHFLENKDEFNELYKAYKEKYALQ